MNDKVRLLHYWHYSYTHLTDCLANYQIFLSRGGRQTRARKDEITLLPLDQANEAAKISSCTALSF